MKQLNIKELKNQALKEIQQTSNLKQLDSLRIKYLGRKGFIANALKSLKNFPQEERRKWGKEINEAKEAIEEELRIRKAEMSFLAKEIEEEWIDITAPSIKHPHGHLHPRTILLRQIEDIFQSLGFSVIEGPEVETEWYNFEALNIPKDHPARDMQDTFYLKNGLIPRTHTSPVQVRYMEKNNPPLRIIVPGRVFRREATDASHDIQFYQVEGLMVDKGVSVANFKAVMKEFFTRLYRKKINIRLRPSYFPFTEPSFEIDISCVFCQGRGCRVCSQTGWVEIAGAGMVNQFVFEAAGYVRNEWQGFAFGIGFERIAMMKYRIDDIRLFSSGDLRFLSQF